MQSHWNSARHLVSTEKMLSTIKATGLLLFLPTYGRSKSRQIQIRINCLGFLFKTHKKQLKPGNQHSATSPYPLPFQMGSVEQQLVRNADLRPHVKTY